MRKFHPSWLVLLAILAVLPLVASTFYISLLNNIGMFALATLGVVLLTGVAGMTSFGQAAFVGLSAYTTAALVAPSTLNLGAMAASPWLALALGLALTLLFAFVLGLITLKLSGHYLPLGTIAWGMSLYSLFGTIESLGGHSGVPDLPPLRIAGLTFGDGPRMYYLIWVCVLLAIVLIRNLLESRVGRAIRALRGGQEMATSMGVNVFRTKMIVFLVAAGLAGVSGWLYAYTQRFVSPAPFGVQAGIDYLFMGLLGGMGSLWGAVIGSAVVVLLREWLQDLLPQLLGRTGNFESIVFGLLIVLVMQRWPGGIWMALSRRFKLRQGGHVRLPAPGAGVPALPRSARPKPNERILDVRKVTRRFGGLVANREMSLRVDAGEILAVIGPNGAGKSTLFNLVSGVDVPNEGDVIFRGHRINGRSPRELAAEGLSRTFQHVKLLPDMTVLENAAIGAHLRGHKGVFASALHLDGEDEARLLAEARRQLERVGLGHELDRTAGSLALGQQRILEIARALCADPCLLLLDEPAAGLRHKEKQALAELLRKLRAEGVAVLLVEHDMDFVMGLVDRVVVMEFGQRIAEGRPEEVQRDPAVLRAYLGGVEE
ncbi:ATP-binding cassette domain-containing protein [Corticibacter populi]|uniref:ATP-binding cassette domain-containing protein n=1 Tax=Corticibacter populi TaxID=1550736 RepID=A0A3M6QX63_9BURK|nr:branched-chain amino acid ABC transporter ATP-binding protein/permease [Corticibacter populi]RMX07606.1 ATP-binding cassette domain-containing protein [Corticibacter populi]RZS30105.1 amino acid/amide ABC transporter membrane protein 2 (HAAT family) /amino acid/amide ABC transporter ATP-binding protein 1 (HAAT family) [Corticibacter populi]